MRVFCASSSLRISRSCGQVTRAPPGARRAMYLASKKPSQRSLASQVVLCQEHSLSANLCQVQHQRLIQSTACAGASTVRMRDVVWFHVRATAPLRKVRLWTGMTNDSWTNDAIPRASRRCMPTRALAAQSCGIAMRLCPAHRHNVLPFGLCGQRHV